MKTRSTAASTAGFTNLRNKVNESVIRIEIIFRQRSPMAGATLPLVASSATLKSNSESRRMLVPVLQPLQAMLIFPHLRMLSDWGDDTIDFVRHQVPRIIAVLIIA